MTLRDKLTVFWLISSELWGREVNILPYFRAELTVIFLRNNCGKCQIFCCFSISYDFQLFIF